MTAPRPTRRVHTLPKSVDCCTIDVQNDADRRAASPGRIGRATLCAESRFMPLNARKIVPLELAAFFLIIAGAIAGDQPTQPETVAPPEKFTAEQRAHWAFQAVQRAELPSVKDTGWVRNAVDQ